MQSRAIIVVNHPPWIFWIAVGWHYIWATGLLIRGSNALNLFVIVGLDWLVRLNLGPYGIAAFLYVISTLAAIGLLKEPMLHTRKGILAFIGPQYFVLIFGFVSDLAVLLRGEFQGKPFNPVIGVMILGLLMWVAVIHSAAFLERYAFRWTH